MSTYLLFARPSFISGMARVLDLGCTLNEYNQSLSPDSADYHAISSDWYAVGADIRAAVANYENDIKNSGSK